MSNQDNASVSDSWQQYQKLVLQKLDEHSSSLNNVNNQLTDLHVKVGQLNVKSGVWGAAAGMIPAVVAVVFVIFFK